MKGRPLSARNRANSWLFSILPVIRQNRLPSRRRSGCKHVALPPAAAEVSPSAKLAPNKKQLALPGVRKTVDPPYGLDHTEDLFMSNLQTCWRRTVCQNRLVAASPQGIAALAAQGGVATLTEQSDARFSDKQFLAADRE